MSDYDLLLRTIDAIYVSAVDREKLPVALDATKRLVGGAGATFEIINKKTQCPTHLWVAGVPTLARAPYLEHFAALNPRIPFSYQLTPGQVAWDRQLLDEREKDRHPFYADFMVQLGIRFFLTAILEQTTEKVTEITVQRAPGQGHVDQREIKLMRQLVPHFQRAHETAERLQVASNQQMAFESTLEWLIDGVALLDKNGRIIYANEAFSTFARRSDAFQITEGMIEFLMPESHDRFKASFNSTELVRNHLSFNAGPNDFPVMRNDDMPAYTFALRPLVRGQTSYSEATVMLLIHDPLARNIAANKFLLEIFNLTNAEAHLAQALCAGMTTATYASTRRVSLNTVYTHLRRIREKTQCNSVAEMVRKLNEFNVPLRLH